MNIHHDTLTTGTHSVNVIRVWDLPTRIFHWSLTACVASLFITGSLGEYAMDWHLRFGYTLFTLLLFRIVWGFVGGYWSRFRQFLFMPSTIWKYVRGSSSLPQHDVGHNPLGSLSVWGLLLILGVQVATGLISDDEITNQGPLSKLVSSATSVLATSYHRHWGKWILLFLLTLHVTAILFYLFKRKQNLIKPMILGDKPFDNAPTLLTIAPQSKDETAQRITALVIFAVIACAVAYGIHRLS